MCGANWRVIVMTSSDSKRRVFGVDYQFLSCGSVFTDGLAHAAADLGVDYQHADWNVPDLPARVRAFGPDLLFVVHGRKFQQWGARVTAPATAVWILDEPYEVDDTSVWSKRFDHVFLNDPATRHRHSHSAYLPVAYDAHVHYPGDESRRRAVGFIGGGNSTRDRYLAALARAGLLSYVVGGTWNDPSVNRLCLSRHITPRETAALYRQTRIVLNVFRETHHFNRDHVPATSLNPRVYEALACGALVASEWRPEVTNLVPELPTFRSVEECVSIVAALLADPNAAEAIRVRCMERLAPHTYAARLQRVLDVACAEVAA
jgi:spore maturation protein CgeB